jgi:hypothetical protein
MHALETLAGALRQVRIDLKEVRAPWLVGGSCGLLLQGVPLTAAPRDLDLYVDAEGSQEVHQALSAYSTDQQKEDCTAIYRSILSHYAIDGIKVELVGGFEVSAHGSLYKVEVGFLSEHYSPEFKLYTGDSSVETIGPLRLMPLEHELLFNLLRSRPDRYEAIAALMRGRQAKLSNAMNDLINRNDLNESLIYELNRLLLA